MAIPHYVAPAAPPDPEPEYVFGYAGRRSASTEEGSSVSISLSAFNANDIVLGCAVADGVVPGTPSGCTNRGSNGSGIRLFSGKVSSIGSLLSVSRSGSGNLIVHIIVYSKGSTTVTASAIATTTGNSVTVSTPPSGSAGALVPFFGRVGNGAESIGQSGWAPTSETVRTLASLASSNVSSSPAAASWASVNFAFGAQLRVVEQP